MKEKLYKVQCHDQWFCQNGWQPDESKAQGLIFSTAAWLVALLGVEGHSARFVAVEPGTKGEE